MERLKKVYRWLRDEESVLAFVVNLLIAFVVIKYLLYPGLGWVLGTPYPVVAVVSGSMEHPGSFDNWWNTMCRKDLLHNSVVTQGDLYANYGIDKQVFSDFVWKNGFNKGDIMVLASPKKIKQGDVIVFISGGPADPIIHRVISVTGGISTKGDNNCVSAGFEQNIPEERVIGKAVVRVPWLGWVKIAFVSLINLVAGGN